MVAMGAQRGTGLVPVGGGLAQLTGHIRKDRARGGRGVPQRGGGAPPPPPRGVGHPGVGGEGG